MKIIKIAIILTDNTESSVRTITDAISSNLPNYFIIEIFSLKKNNPLPPENIKYLFNNIRHLKNFDIIHLQTALPISFALLIRLMYPKVKLISTDHDFGWNYFKNTLPLYKSLILRFFLYLGRNACHLNTFPSNSLFNAISENKFLNKKHIVVYNGISDFYFPKRDNIFLQANSIKKIVVVGNYFFSKGIDLIFSVIKDFPDIEFHLFGDILNGVSDKILSNIEDTLNQKNVFIHGKVSRKTFLNYLKHENCVVCIPSRSESFCLVALEGMASEHPLVLSNIPVFHELTNRDFSRIFDLNDIDSLKKAINEAFLNYNDLAVNSRKVFVDKFTELCMANEYQKVYENLLNTKQN